MLQASTIKSLCRTPPKAPSLMPVIRSPTVGAHTRRLTVQNLRSPTVITKLLTAKSRISITQDDNSRAFTGSESSPSRNLQSASPARQRPHLHQDPPSPTSRGTHDSPASQLGRGLLPIYVSHIIYHQRQHHSQWPTNHNARTIHSDLPLRIQITFVPNYHNCRRDTTITTSLDAQDVPVELGDARERDARGH